VAPVFLRVLAPDLMAVYGFARLVDDIGDGDLADGGRPDARPGPGSATAEDRTAMLDAFERSAPGVRRRPPAPAADALQPTVRRHT